MKLTFPPSTKVLYLHCTTNMMVSMATFFTRSEVLLPLVGGSYDRVRCVSARGSTGLAQMARLGLVF
jgi:hypothetical protein